MCFVALNVRIGLTHRQRGTFSVLHNCSKLAAELTLSLHDSQQNNCFWVFCFLNFHLFSYFLLTADILAVSVFFCFLSADSHFYLPGDDDEADYDNE